MKLTNYLKNPDDKRQFWTAEEDNQLLQLRQELGPDWAAIAKRMGAGRYVNECPIPLLTRIECDPNKQTNKQNKTNKTYTTNKQTNKRNN